MATQQNGLTCLKRAVKPVDAGGDLPQAVNLNINFSPHNPVPDKPPEMGGLATDAIPGATKTRLIAGKTGLDAGSVEYGGADYRVTFVDPYSHYAAGFVRAHCELWPSVGGVNEQ